jgi:hypothetical protein
MKKKFIAALLLLLVLSMALVTLVACTPENNNDSEMNIVGTWKAIDAKAYDGSELSQMEINDNLTWNYKGEEHIKAQTWSYNETEKKWFFWGFENKAIEVSFDDDGFLVIYTTSRNVKWERV